jgi:nucleoside-diphosphate-sugar epimerase
VDIFFKHFPTKNTSAFILRNQNADDVHGRCDCGNHKIMQAPVEEIKLDLRILAAMSFTPTEIAAEIKKHIPEFTITYEPDFVKKYNSWPASIDDASAREDWGWKHEFDLNQ